MVGQGDAVSQDLSTALADPAPRQVAEQQRQAEGDQALEQPALDLMKIQALGVSAVPLEEALERVLGFNLQRRGALQFVEGVAVGRGRYALRVLHVVPFAIRWLGNRTDYRKGTTSFRSRSTTPIATIT